LDVDAIVRQAQRANAVIVMTCAVGDTLVDDTLLMQDPWISLANGGFGRQLRHDSYVP
jgi:uncharacterized membrane protein